MIVVIGLPAYVDSPDGERCAGGLAVEVASAAQRRGSTVELVGKVGNDGAGDAVVVALGRFGIGHAALLRDPILPTPVLATSPGSDDEAEVDAGAEIVSLEDADADAAAPDKVAVTLYRDPSRGEGEIDRSDPGSFALIAETPTPAPPGVLADHPAPLADTNLYPGTRRVSGRPSPGPQGDLYTIARPHDATHRITIR